MDVCTKKEQGLVTDYSGTEIIVLKNAVKKTKRLELRVEEVKKDLERFSCNLGNVFNVFKVKMKQHGTQA